MNNVILVPFQTVRRIIHLADIHVRLFKRHEEYRNCFARLYNDISHTDLSNTVIVVAGDIVHSKTDLSPEMVSLASDFLGNLATLAPTLVIAGNHDLNVSNKQRLDALTPIVENLKHPNLHYLRDSGVYTCADVDFYVYSILSEQSDWSKPKTNGRCKVALYHGPVHSATTDIGYTITNKHLMVDTFDGFDMVLLGDIHRHQVLKERAPKIVYCGSLIQQDHGESRTGHGWCDWDVSARDFVFRELYNRYGYYTLTVGPNGEIPTYDDMPENVRLRIFAGSLEQSEIKKLVSTIRSKRNVTDLAVSTFAGMKQGNITSSGQTLLDIHQVDVQNQLLTEFIHSALPETTEDVIQRVIELNTRLNAEVTSDDPTRKLLWRPLSLHFDNLFTYGEGNVVNFDTMNGVIGVFAPNASGKTSIPDALCFALYDRTPRTTKAANIMNTRATKCYCKLRFEVNGEVYAIERRGTKNKKGEVKIDVDFYRVNSDGSTHSLNGEERRYTNANIRNYVGDFEDFVLTTFSTQGQNSLFVDRGQSDRKDLLSQFMGLTIFDKLHLIANEESKEVAGALKRFKTADFTQELADVQQDMVKEELLLDTAQKMLDETNDMLNDLTQSIQRSLAKKRPVAKMRSLDAVIAAQNAALTKSESLEVDAAAIERSILDLTEKLGVAEGKIQEFGDIAASYFAYKKLKDKADAYTSWVRPISDQKTYLWRQLTDIEEKFHYDPNCVFCVTNGKHTIELCQELREKIAKLDRQIQDRAAAERHIWEVELPSYPKDIEDQYNKFVAAQDWIVRHRSKKDALELQYAKLQTDRERMKTSLAALDRELEDIKAAEEALKHNESIDAFVTHCESSKLSHKKEYNVRLTSVQGIKTKLALLAKRKDDMLNSIKEAEELETKYEAYDVYLKAVSRDGLPYKLISEVLPVVQNEVNELLSQMVEFGLLFESDGKNINIKLSYSDDRLWPLELASGMEKFISGLAIRVALMRVSSLPKSNFLIVDEGFGALDPENLLAIFKLFEMLRHNFDFLLVISHVDAARDIADTLVDIKRSDGFSTVTV